MQEINKLILSKPDFGSFLKILKLLIKTGVTTSLLLSSILSITKMGNSL